MGAEYKLQIKSSAGAVQAELYGEAGGVGASERGGFLSVACAKGLGEAGELETQINARSDAALYLVDKAQLELFRRWPEVGLPWYSFFTGIVRDDVRETGEDGVELLTVNAFGPLHILNWRFTAYPAETSNKTMWSGKAVETVVKNIVATNFTTTATTGNGRDRNGTTSGAVNGYTITVEADQARGPAIDFNAARTNCLKAIRDALEQAGTGDVDLVQTGPATFQFRYYPVRGTDRSSSVIFAVELETMRKPKLVRRRSDEATAIIVAGGGQKDRRAKVVRTGSTWSAGNDIEEVVNGATTTGGSTSTSVLNGIGDREKTKRRMRPELTFEILQAPALLFDRDYFLGDLTTARYAGATFVQQIASVDASWKPGQHEDLQIGARDYGS